MPPDSDDEEEFTSRHMASIIDKEVTSEFDKPTKKYEIKLGMNFIDATMFIEYIIGHSIQEGYEMELNRTNGQNRAEVRCKQANCGFKACVVQLRKQSTFQLKNLVDEHRCG